jgi:hypothetical protein
MEDGEFAEGGNLISFSSGLHPLSTMSRETSSMTDHDTPDQTEGAPASTTEPSAAAPQHGDREWVLPVAAIGGVLLAVAVFFFGFFVGRATDGTESADASSHMVVRVVPDRDPRGGGFSFDDLVPGGPQGRFGNPDITGPLGDLGQLAKPRLDRLCSFLENGSIPEQAPFLDQLKELCTSLDA